ncbi:hypothetical protein KI387_015950, partial [Taxus chinensis]
GFINNLYYTNLTLSTVYESHCIGATDYQIVFLLYASKFVDHHLCPSQQSLLPPIIGRITTSCFKAVGVRRMPEKVSEFGLTSAKGICLKCRRLDGNALGVLVPAWKRTSYWYEYWYAVGMAGYIPTVTVYATST